MRRDGNYTRWELSNFKCKQNTQTISQLIPGYNESKEFYRLKLVGLADHVPLAVCKITKGDDNKEDELLGLYLGTLPIHYTPVDGIEVLYPELMIYYRTSCVRYYLEARSYLA